MTFDILLMFKHFHQCGSIETPGWWCNISLHIVEIRKNIKCSKAPDWCFSAALIDAWG